MTHADGTAERGGESDIGCCCCFCLELHHLPCNKILIITGVAV